MRRQENDIERKLDLVIMNSVLWDMNRWGPNFVTDYKKNLVKLLDCVKSVLAEDGMFIWLTAQPGTLVKLPSRIYVPYARHYKPRLVFFLPIFHYGCGLYCRQFMH